MPIINQNSVGELAKHVGERVSQTKVLGFIKHITTIEHLMKIHAFEVRISFSSMYSNRGMKLSTTGDGQFHARQKHACEFLQDTKTCLLVRT